MWKHIEIQFTELEKKMQDYFYDGLYRLVFQDENIPDKIKIFHVNNKVDRDKTISDIEDMLNDEEEKQDVK